MTNYSPSADSNITVRKNLLDRAATSSSQSPQSPNGKDRNEDIFFRAGYGNLLWAIFTWVARAITGGLATPFLDTYYYTRFVESIRFRGRRMVMRASLGDFIVIAIGHYFMSAITLGAWMLVADRVTARFVDSRLEWRNEDEEHGPTHNLFNTRSQIYSKPRENIHSMFNPDIIFFSARPLVVFDWIFYALTVVSLGLAYPWLMCWYYRVWCANSKINGERIRFVGKPKEFFELFIVDLVLSICTCGLWKVCCAGGRMSRYLDRRIEWS